MTILSKHLPPGPYTFWTTAANLQNGPGHVYIVDANGRKIAAVWGPYKTKLATAELIILARDRLRPASKPAEAGPSAGHVRPLPQDLPAPVRPQDGDHV